MLLIIDYLILLVEKFTVTYWCKKIIIYQLLQRKMFQIISYLSGYVFLTFYWRLRSTKPNTNSYYQQQCLSFLMARKCFGENLPSPVLKHIEILDWDGLWKVDDNVTLIFKVAEYYFKTISSIWTTKIDCKTLCPPWWKILLFIKKFPRSEVNRLTKLFKRKRRKSPWRSSNIVYSCQDIFFCKRPDTKW